MYVNTEIVIFVLYLALMIGIGIYFFIRDREGGEKTYFLGGRQMGAWVAGLSAGASDMSAWVLMGPSWAVPSNSRRWVSVSTRRVCCAS